MPLLRNPQNQPKYVSMQNCIKIWPAVFKLWTIFLRKKIKIGTQGQRSKVTKTLSLLGFIITHIHTNLHQFPIRIFFSFFCADRHTYTYRFLSGCEEVENHTSQLSSTSQLRTTSQHHSPKRILPCNHTNITIHAHTTPTHTVLYANDGARI